MNLNPSVQIRGLLTDYSKESNPFKALAQKSGDCISGALIGYAFDPERLVLRHSVSRSKKDPRIHFLAYLPSNRNFIDTSIFGLALNDLERYGMHCTGLARNRLTATTRALIGESEELSPISRVSERIVNLKWVGVEKVVRIALIDPFILLESVAPGSDMGVLRDEVLERCEENMSIS